MPACARCGNQNPSSAKFCNACGNRLDAGGHPPATASTFLGGLWRRIPKWRYLVVAGLVVASTMLVKWVASDNPGFENRVRVAATQLEASLELLDITNLAKAYWSAVTDHVWECGETCRPSLCGMSSPSLCLSICALSEPRRPRPHPHPGAGHIERCAHDQFPDRSSDRNSEGCATRDGPDEHR